MHTLDSSDAARPNKPIWDTVLRYGGYNGLIAIALSMAFYLLGLDIFSISGMLTATLLPVTASIIMAVVAIKHQRDQLDGGYIKFGKALQVGLFVVFAGSFISSLWNYLLVTVIDPGYIDQMKENFANSSFGSSVPPEAMEEALKGFDKMGDLTQTLTSGLGGGLFWGLVVGLIAAAALKKEN
jgi:hypothetical protein